MCHRSINYMAEMMESKFGIPWIKVNFIGAEQHRQVACARSPSISATQKLTDRVEEVIAQEMAGAAARAGGREGPAARARPPRCSSAAPAPTTTRTCSTTSA